MNALDPDVFKHEVKCAVHVCPHCTPPPSKKKKQGQVCLYTSSPAVLNPRPARLRPSDRICTSLSMANSILACVTPARMLFHDRHPMGGVAASPNGPAAAVLATRVNARLPFKEDAMLECVVLGIKTSYNAYRLWTDPVHS